MLEVSKKFLFLCFRNKKEQNMNISKIWNILFSLAGDIIADKYKILFKQELQNLENIAGSMPILSEDLTGHKNIRKINVRNYIVFYIVDDENSKALVVRIGHAFMDWE